MEYEKERGRHPHEMPINNPGYDVASKNDAGETARYIEVKSMSGKWGAVGAALSDTQFEHATKHGDRFWLYVVEYAEQDNYRIYRIRDPARRVDQFIYDDGWEALAEDDATAPLEVNTDEEPT
jgi:hypothetical protein